MANLSNQQRGKRHAAQTDASRARAVAGAAFSTLRHVKYLLLLFAFCLAVSLPAGVAFAQSVNGLISGTVVDPQGASVSAAVVTVTTNLPPVVRLRKRRKVATSYSLRSGRAHTPYP
jgi:hypothetical protein